MLKLCRINATKIVCYLAAALALASCGGSDERVTDDLADINTYKSDSPYAGTMDDCVRARNDNSYCTLERLPLLGMEYDDPGIPQIMERVTVSHAWMGARFEELLYEMPAEMLPLFKAITAIVIDADIRPAYYTARTGAIYLDPAFLWLTIDEKLTINTKLDYRAGFDDPLVFRQLNRYLIDGQPAYKNASLTDTTTRTLEDIEALVARLLLHELAHANDFIPPGFYDQLDPRQTLSQAATSLSEYWISTRLTNTNPLISDKMFSLAGVMYLGNDPTLEDLETSAAEVGEAFAPDGAGDDYGYSTQYEDMAMLFETAMMKHFFNADYEVAFTSVPENPRACSSYIIGWGSRNRAGDESVVPRARFVSEALLPQLELDAFFDSIAGPTEISGDWCLESGGTAQQKTQLHPVDPYELMRPYL